MPAATVAPDEILRIERILNQRLPYMIAAEGIGKVIGVRSSVVFRLMQLGRGIQRPDQISSMIMSAKRIEQHMIRGWTIDQAFRDCNGT